MSTTTVTEVTKQRMSRSKIVDLMRNSGGKFMTVTFTKKAGAERTMNCKVAKGQNVTTLGYLPVTETKTKSLKNVDPRTISSLKLSSVVYTAR